MNAENLQEGSGVSTDEFSSSFLQGVEGDVLEVATFWNQTLLSVNVYSEAFRVGQGLDTDFPIEALAFPQPLVNVTSDGRTLTVHESMFVYINDRQDVWTLEDFIADAAATSLGNAWWSIDLGDSLRAQVILGDYSFLIRFSDALEAGHHITMDRDPLPYIGMSAGTHVLMLLLIMAMPDAAGALELDGHLSSDRFVQLALQADQEEPQKPDWLADASDSSQASAKHAGAEGAAGDPDEIATDKRMAIKGPADNEDLVLKKLRDQEIALSAGIAAPLEVASLFGSADSSIGSDALHAIGAIEGATVGGSKGVFGLGIQGGMRGGGGVTEGSIGLARIATKGKSSGRDFGKGVADVGERDAKIPGRVIPQPIATLSGGLDREIIKRVVRQRRREIKSCYEPELQKNKQLSGEVVVKFTISAAGSVIAATTDRSTLKNAKVERCMNGKIRRWVFPEPEGGGMVLVRYPFRFAPQ